MRNKVIRDPALNNEHYDEFFEYFVRPSSFDKKFCEEFAELKLENKAHRMTFFFSSDREYIINLYGCGDPLDSILQELRIRIASMELAAEFVRAHNTELEGWSKDTRPIGGEWRRDFQFAGIALLLLESADDLKAFDQLVSVESDRGYLLDLLIKSFIPEHTLARKYSNSVYAKYAQVWTHPVTRALALPAADRPAALASFMGRWERMMRPYRKRHPDGDRLIAEFAYEIALAVCAYDIDDSSFSSHPYYPAELVRHYRQNLRWTRDAWRAEGAGAGVPVIAPPPPKKADLSRSKRKNLARWVELVSDGDVDATEAVLERTGKLRKVRDVYELMAALQEEGQAIHADIKDDDSVSSQAEALAEARGLGEFEGPAEPPAGPARCVAVLRAFTGWVAERGYRLVAVEGEDDAWHGVLVKAAYHEELLSLSGSLGIDAQEPAQVYGD
jgi:hypothetical protein